MFLAISAFFLLSNVLITFGNLNNGTDGHWVADNSSKLITDGNSFSCSEFCYAMWQEGDCVSSGEHLWRIHFESELWLQAVQLTNKEKFAEDFGYGDNNNHRVKPGDTLEILASFSNGKLKGYFGYDNESLGQNFELDSASLSSVCPAIRFYGPGKIRIENGASVSSGTARKDLRNFVEMEGTWHLFPENAKFGEGDLSSNISDSPFLGRNSRKSIATLTIEPSSESNIGQYSMGLRVVNSIGLEIRMYDDSWRSNTSPVTTLIGGPPQIMKLEQQLTKLVQNPDSVKIISGNLVLKKGNMVATFVR